MQVNNHLSFPGAPAITSALEKGAVKIRDRDQSPKPEPVKQSSDTPTIKKEASTEEINRPSQITPLFDEKILFDEKKLKEEKRLEDEIIARAKT